MADAGQNIHGEADLVEHLLRESGGTRVLDAGCGTGRVAIELADRGLSVIGVDADAAMMDAARTKGPELSWVDADLVEHGAVGGELDLVVAAGNVMIFLTPGTERAVVGQLANRLAPDGLLVSGFQLNTGRLGPLERYDEYAAAAGS